MKVITIDISEETISLEKMRPPEAMHYEDFLWCIGVNFQLEDNRLTIDAPLIGFMKKLINAEIELKGHCSGHRVVVEDEDQSYQISISHNDDIVCIQESFGNAVARLPDKLFWTSVRAEYLNAVDKLERAVPGFIKNADYQIIKLEIQNALDVW